MYVNHMYSMANRLLRTDIINFSNSVKIEMCGNSRAVLSYILLSSNYPTTKPAEDFIVFNVGLLQVTISEHSTCCYHKHAHKKEILKYPILISLLSLLYMVS